MSLTLQSISKTYPNTPKPILDNVSLSINPKDFVTIGGPSGSGKSTLLHVMGGLDTFDKGTLSYKNQNFADFSEGDWLKFRRFEVSFIFQFFHLFGRLSVLENILIPAELAAKDREQAETRAHELIEALSLSGKASQKAQTLSGGEMQRVAIARALLNRPQMLFADEPTGNLDSKNADLFLKALFDLQSREQFALVIVTHDLSLFEQGSQRFDLRDGHLKTCP